jgi:apolipoprotein N-acyltransferase
VAPENSRANQSRKQSPYRLPAVIGVAGVLLLVLGFSIPGWGWLAWTGFALLIAAAFSVGISFFAAWIPSLFCPDNQDDLPPPPTVER